LGVFKLAIPFRGVAAFLSKARVYIQKLTKDKHVHREISVDVAAVINIFALQNRRTEKNRSRQSSKQERFSNSNKTYYDVFIRFSTLIETKEMGRQYGKKKTRKLDLQIKLPVMAIFVRFGSTYLYKLSFQCLVLCLTEYSQITAE